MITRETIYKRTRTGAVQIWFAQVEGDKYRTTSGQENGKHTTSEWTICEPKNEGRSNATTGEEQALREVEAMYTKRLEREYRRTKDNIDIKLYTKPMKCDKWKEVKKRPKPGTLILIEPKFDGFRCNASADGLKSQDGKHFPGAQFIMEFMEDVLNEYPDIQLDGELYNHDFKTDFEGLSSIIKKGFTPGSPEEARARQYLQLHLYDIVIPDLDYYVGDVDGNMQDCRIKRLFEIFDKYLEKYPVFKLSPMHVELMDEDGTIVDNIVGEYMEDEYEGGIIKVAADGGYKEGRSSKHYKYKEFQDAEFEIFKIEEGKGNWAGAAKVVWIGIPTAPIRMGDMVWDRDTEELKIYTGTEPNVIRVSKATTMGSYAANFKLLADWEAGLIKGKFGTVQFFRYTVDGVPYLPHFKTVRWDI